MSTRLEDHSLLRFSVYELDLLTDELRKHGRALRVPPKPLRLLRLLATRAGDLVTRDEIKAFLWPATNIDVDRNINLLINKVREILGDDAENPHYIETLPLKGYRFIYPVAIETRADSSSSGKRLLAKAEGMGTWRDRSYRAHVRRALLLVALIAGLLLAAALLLTHQRQHMPLVTTQARLAVLPVENLTGDSGREYVADGLTEEIIAQLGSLNAKQLEVIARTSVMPYKHTSKTVAQVGRELQVNDVLECSLREWEKQVRINCQLIAVHNQAQVWAKTYQSSQRDILNMQSEIANAVAKELSLTLSGQQQAPVASRDAVDDRVHDLLLRGRYEWRARKNARLKKAIKYFEQAIALDPTYAPSYADLASAYAVLPYYSDNSPNEALPKAKAVAERALQLDGTLWEAHTVLGLVECSYLNLEAGEREYQRALQLNPNYATAHHWHSFCLWTMNRRKEALIELQAARALDPLSWIIYADEALTLAADHQPDKAILLLKTAVDSEPEFAEAHRALSVVYVQKGDMSQAINEARQAVEMDPNNSAKATLGYVYAAAGRTAEANKILASLIDPARHPSVPLAYISFIYIGLGNKDEALSCLERADRENSLLNGLNTAEVIFDPIRSDPRFLDLLRRRNLVLAGSHH